MKKADGCSRFCGGSLKLLGMLMAGIALCLFTIVLVRGGASEADSTNGTVSITPPGTTLKGIDAPVPYTATCQCNEGCSVIWKTPGNTPADWTFLNNPQLGGTGTTRTASGTAKTAGEHTITAWCPANGAHGKPTATLIIVEVQMTTLNVTAATGTATLSVTVTPANLQLASARLYADTTLLSTLQSPSAGSFSFSTDADDLLGKGVHVEVLPTGSAQWFSSATRNVIEWKETGAASSAIWTMFFLVDGVGLRFTNVTMNVSYEKVTMAQTTTSGRRSHVGNPLLSNDHSTFMWVDPYHGTGNTITMTGNLTYTANGPAGTWTYGDVKEPCVIPANHRIKGATPDVRHWLTGQFTGKATMTAWYNHQFPDTLSPHTITSSATAP